MIGNGIAEPWTTGWPGACVPGAAPGNRSRARNSALPAASVYGRWPGPDTTKIGQRVFDTAGAGLHQEDAARGSGPNAGEGNGRRPRCAPGAAPVHRSKAAPPAPRAGRAARPGNGKDTPPCAPATPASNVRAARPWMAPRCAWRVRPWRRKAAGWIGKMRQPEGDMKNANGRGFAPSASRRAMGPAAVPRARGGHTSGPATSAAYPTGTPSSS